MPSTFENLPPNREHSDSSAVAEAVWRELQKSGERTPEVDVVAEMLDPSAVEAYAQERNDETRKAMLRKLVESVLEKEDHF